MKNTPTIFLPSILFLQKTPADYINLKVYGHDNLKFNLKIRKDVPIQDLVDVYCIEIVSVPNL